MKCREGSNIINGVIVNNKKERTLGTIKVGRNRLLSM